MQAYRADTGEKLLELETGMSQMGPPISYMIDGKQYIVITGGAPQGGGRGGAGAAKGKGPEQGKGAPAAPPQPSRMLALVLDGSPLN